MAAKLSAMPFLTDPTGSEDDTLTSNDIYIYMYVCVCIYIYI